jgi:hypothetical protein
VTTAEQTVRDKWQRLKHSMDERVQRLWAGTEAEAIGWGGVAAVARATGLAISTVRKGRDEGRASSRPSQDPIRAASRARSRRSARAVASTQGLRSGCDYQIANSSRGCFIG